MTTQYRIVRSRQADRDIRSILRFLIQNHMRSGASFAEAKDRGAAKILAIRDAMKTLTSLPHRATRRDALLPGLRNVTKDRAIFYFTVDDEARFVRVLAVFFGGQDHQREMLKRLRKLK
jgi:toxin ParE1/3/4